MPASYPVSTAVLVGQSSTLDLMVEQPGYAWLQQQPRWELIEHLLGGTLMMQAGGRRWLPQMPGEEDASYAVRLSASTLPPYYERMENMLAGMLTRKPISLDDVPDKIREHTFNINLLGDNLDVWAFNTAKVLIRYGHIGTLVDYGRDEKFATDRPYWCNYSPREILGFRPLRENNTQQLGQLRLYERMVLALENSEFGEEMVEQVRVLEPGKFRLFRKRASTSQSFAETPDPENGRTTIAAIPFAVAYANRVGLLESKPPLEEIAHLNLKAYRRESDLANQLTVAAVAQQFFFGFPAELEKSDAGPGKAMHGPADGRVEFVEPPGKSYEYQFKHLEHIERQISELGMAAILGQAAFQESGVAKSINRSQGDSMLMSVALQLQDLINNCLQFHAAYLGLDFGGTATVNRDFVAQKLEPAAVQQLIQLELSGKITQETLLAALVDGEWFPELDVKAEIEATAALQAQRLKQQADRLGGALGKLGATDQSQKVPPAA